MLIIYNKTTEEYKEHNNAIRAQHLPVCNYCIITVTLDTEATGTAFILYKLFYCSRNETQYNNFVQ